MRVLVVDDQDLFRGGFSLILSAEPDITVVGEATDGLEAVAQAETLAPDVVVMDIRMPRLDGVEATARICARTAAKVLVLTMFDVDEYVYAALRAGASGFLLKDARREELVAAVRVVAAGEALLAPAITRRVIAQLAGHGGPRPELANRLAELTDRERDTLRELARGQSNAEIARALTVTEHTVKTHVSAVLSKLDLRDRVQAVVFAYEAGLVVPGREG
ncbi:response regulator [Nocardia seriolae]|uniref:Chemotaxis response regulator protein-glutamate methylesterase of group 1 operon n=1 Tax=Nocardia seriolae TaxID=37332 RepID=A0A0B8NJG4_9NOCA|nr:response regulator transcription factor [Nocardia seriolae]APB01429.1 Chemotaxis response regulator protein-glutamate methylesterase of group 1 operon [Nocardia seriolae]MTJ61079.1 response regulator [Nocardia seriolae]MTJ70460.1 response regulator [Nocardia seriolae]MTJ90789.1 response regulator [Nocardia seriolae]MTK34747.1 response regulator [Nocardia seriolae]